MTRRVAAAVAVAVTLVAAGCQGWQQPGFGPGNTFYNPDETGLTVTNVATLSEAWSGPGAVAAVADGKVFGVANTANGLEILARKVTTGEVAWSHTLAPPSPSAWATHQPVVVGDQVWTGYVARTGATCSFGLARFALGAGTLLENDTSFAPGELVPFGGAVGLDRRVYTPANFGHGDTCMYGASHPGGAADKASGDILWTDELEDSASRIVVVGDSLYMLAGEIRRYDAAGCGAALCRRQWSAWPTQPGVSDDLTGTATGPLVSVAPTAAPGGSALYTIDPATGAKLSETPLSFPLGSLALANGIAYVAGDTKVAAYDVAACTTGPCAQLWQAPVGGQVTWADGLAVAGGVVYVGRADGTVEAFAAAGCGSSTCAAVHSVSVGDTVMSLAVADGHLFVGTIDTMTAFAPG